MAINLSARQFSDRGFLDMVTRVLAETGLEPQWLELEITESQVMRQTEGMIMLLNKLSEMGVQLAIDDFGTGYSSLSYLKRLPIQKLKIDQSFVRDITVDPNDTAIVVAIINMAQQPRPRDDRRGRGDRGAAGAAALEGMPHGAGVLLLRAGARRSALSAPEAEQPLPACSRARAERRGSVGRFFVAASSRKIAGRLPMGSWRVRQPSMRIHANPLAWSP